jgi:hypothetical protein
MATDAPTSTDAPLPPPPPPPPAEHATQSRADRLADASAQARGTAGSRSEDVRPDGGSAGDQRRNAGGDDRSVERDDGSTGRDGRDSAAVDRPGRPESGADTQTPGERAAQRLDQRSGADPPATRSGDGRSAPETPETTETAEAAETARTSGAAEPSETAEIDPAPIEDAQGRPENDPDSATGLERRGAPQHLEPTPQFQQALDDRLLAARSATFDPPAAEPVPPSETDQPSETDPPREADQPTAAAEPADEYSESPPPRTPGDQLTGDQLTDAQPIDDQPTDLPEPSVDRDGALPPASVGDDQRAVGSRSGGGGLESAGTDKDRRTSADVDDLEDGSQLGVASDADQTELFSRSGNLTNAEVIEQGIGLERNMDTVNEFARLAGVDFQGAQVEILSDPETIRYLDLQHAVARTDEYGVQLGPAAFQDAETLVRTLGHESIHIDQHRQGRVNSTGEVTRLEDEAYGAEDRFVEEWRSSSG